MTERLTIAIQKKGRLTDVSCELFGRIGLDLPSDKNQLFYSVKEMPVDLIMMRADDIPRFLNEGMCDMGIVGENSFVEFNGGRGDSAAVKLVKRLGSAKCRLSLAVPEGSAFRSLRDFDGTRIATSFPQTLKRFMDAKGIETRVVYMTGSVEVAPRMKVADAICDLVESGRTLRANNLVEFGTVLESQAVLLRRQNLAPEKIAIMQNMLVRINAPKMVAPLLPTTPPQPARSPYASLVTLSI